MIPVIDLFAGPGGLGEGFSTYQIGEKCPFRVKLSIEMDLLAHKTLSLRAFYRHFIHSGVPVPPEYYLYMAGKTGRGDLFEKYPEAANQAENEAICAELGGDKWPDNFFDHKITDALISRKQWLLIGGPPCQAYSLVGRSRMLGALKDKDGCLVDEGRQFFEDHRHKLYEQYLRIIAKHWPPVFVMENVKGILSSKLNGGFIFPAILKDLRNPSQIAGNNQSQEHHTYKTVSFVTGREPEKNNNEFLIRAEEYGIPQARHRVIILGIRDDIHSKINDSILSLQKCGVEITVSDIIGGLPAIRSEISRRNVTNADGWKDYLESVRSQSWFNILDSDVRQIIDQSIQKRRKITLKMASRDKGRDLPQSFRQWYHDDNLINLSHHEARKHMSSDLYRYLFVSAYGIARNNSPRLKDFPEELLPNHQNAKPGGELQNFADRFKVQLWHKPASTITSHISKDGHYFIHPDPVQCRSLTVREAARLQTFPDNYYFEGNKTQQYHQVGNAVPPLLARQLAAIVYEIFLGIA